MRVCDICGKRICPPACPSYNGRSAELGRPIGICRKCGRNIYASEKRQISAGRLICHECGAAPTPIFIRLSEDRDRTTEERRA